MWRVSGSDYLAVIAGPSCTYNEVVQSLHPADSVALERILQQNENSVQRVSG